MEQPAMKTPSRRISTSHYPACRSGELRPRGPELVANCDEKHQNRKCKECLKWR